ncbi:hypothetical protein DL765_007743 [Monosporascus sp. GIB2]|nr:hypothetical protein DL765_007743 [Monosporascus sp. GIB2]
MNSDAGLLPHRTGIRDQASLDEVAVLTRASLLEVSATCIQVVLDQLLQLLEDLARPYNSFASHPPHVVASEVYILSLAAECCSAHWASLRDDPHDGSGGVGASSNTSWSSGRRTPKPLENAFVARMFEHFKFLSNPVADNFALTARAVLDEESAKAIFDPPETTPSRVTSSSGSEDFKETVPGLRGPAVNVEPYLGKIIEFVTASNWPATFDYIRAVVVGIRNSVPAQGVPIMNAAMVPTAAMVENEKSTLVTLALFASIWLDAQKLSMVIQEFCSNFLHFQKPFQSTVAGIVPLLVGRKLHGADTFFDMTQTIVETGRRRMALYPLQMSLLLLQPEVFEVACNFRDAKTTSIAKRVSFLENVKKAVRNRNEIAIYSLIGAIRAARFIVPEGEEAAIVSYALDIQDELRDAVLGRHQSGADGVMFDQDVTTVSFICLSELNFTTSVEELTEMSLQPSAPQIFKIALIQTCTYFARQSDPERFRPLFQGVAPFVQDQLKAMISISENIYEGDAGSQRKALEAFASKSTMICNILKFLNESPATLFECPPEDPKSMSQFYEENFEACISCTVVADDVMRDLARQLSERLIADNTILASLQKSMAIESRSFLSKYWKLTSHSMNSLCEKHLQQEDIKAMRYLYDYVKAGLMIMNSLKELLFVPAEMPEFMASVRKAETTLLVSLCSPDIELCQLVTMSMGLFLQGFRDLDPHRSDPSKTAIPMFRNCHVYDEIAMGGTTRITGVVAFQKRLRALYRSMQYPSAGIVDAWELAFDKWLHLSKDISTTPMENVDEMSFLQWRNLSGFLASIGGVCTAGQSYALEESAMSGLRWIDKLPSEYHEEPLLIRYLRLSIQLLACSNVRVRETIREVLSSEISPQLYQFLFQALESELEVLFTGALEATSKNQDVEIIFAEQASGLLRALVERLQTPAELGTASSVHLGSITLGFAKFLDGVLDHTNTLRVKIKVCNLCETVTRKKEHLNLRDDIRIRNQLLEYIFSWIARPRTPRNDNHSGSGRQDEHARVQRDLDKACLRSLAELTYRLPLQPGDGQSDANSSEMKSQMFHTYFNRFLSLLNYEATENSRGELALPGRDEATTMSELAITILSNLLSANIDVGLKHSLSIGYHENVDIRTAFVKVLYNILLQGTEFSNLSDAAVNEKYNALLELLTHDMSLAVAISSVCPSSEVEELTISLLNVFESRGLTFDLMEALIRQEIEETENESEILRRNCVATKMLSIYAKWRGANYLKATLQKVLERLMLTSNELDLELDPTRITSEEEAKRNAMQLRIVAKVFIDDICASYTSIPPSFRKICSIISAAVKPRFSEAKYTAVGSFIFLRFFCPAIVAPETDGLVSTPPSKELRRGLLLIAKVIQNLANNVLFGAKEPYMYGLNDFLTQNIYKVTTFLREISVPPKDNEVPAADFEAYDFGSCVALHRFLYDHWDHVRQRVMSQERRDNLRSPTEIARGRSPVLEPLRALITNLGPPPLAVTWNRPQIATNDPCAYSRFQHFMLRNAFRSTESFITSRAVYDGGESKVRTTFTLCLLEFTDLPKDGLSIICVILRHIDQGSIDYDTLLYCYLKIASRLWHKPFGLLIDATCYPGNNEPQDDLFKKLDLLSPAELSENLTRIYVYNMNSAFRKCLRRILRVTTKSETSTFSPANVDYLLLGTLQDLQTHFHLSQLHLPKETISVVTDTRYVFQPLTRLSKTKGKIEVTIKVGSQFVQIATTKKQEVHPTFRLNAVTNDIFRLGDIEEVPTPFANEDDSAFGLRADNGKVVMYFQGTKKFDVLQAIRSAKMKYAKDTRTTKSFERFIRPQDVPGTLLNLALTNLGAVDPVLRTASYNLLGALCRAFKFKAASKFLCIKDVAVPLDPSQFVVNVSRALAQEEPQLTADFLNEFFVGWESFSDEQKPLSLAYIAPWISGLRVALLGDETDSEKGREKIAAIFAKLIDVTTVEPSLALVLENTVWPAIYEDEVLLDIFFDEICKTALAVGLYDEHTQCLNAILTAIGTITLRGKVVSRLRKALNRSSLRPTRYLPDNPVWNEICMLLQFCLSLSFNCGVQAQLYLPEIFHIVTMLANTGTADIRILVHKLLVNSIHAAYTSFNLDETKQTKLRGILDILVEPRNDIFAPPPIYPRDGSSASTNHEAAPTLVNVENLAGLLFEVCAVAAPSVDMANVWRSRWMSLVSSTAFQNNPAIQPRAFAVMGCLAREEVDDDSLYQVLVALRGCIGRSADDSGTDMLVSIVTALSRMLAKLSSMSRYGLQLFWLAISLIRLVPAPLFNCTAMFLESVLTNISTSNELRGQNMAHVLLQGRIQLEDVATPLDDTYGIHFTQGNFHFAVCACLVRGLTDTVTKGAALRVLSTLLEMTTEVVPKSSEELPPDFYTSPYLALIQARAVTTEELKECLWSAGINPVGVANLASKRRIHELPSLKDLDILTNLCIEMVDFELLEDAAQNHTLSWLNEVASERPSVISHLSSSLIARLDEVLTHCENIKSLESAHTLLRTLSTRPEIISCAGDSTASGWSDVLEQQGLEGLTRTCSSHQNQDLDRDCSALVEKLIELIIV